ncbi:hypothetical protein AB4Z17_24470 [Paenibacillus sp. TAF43_2]|uniref:ORC-CDC6 family AAA ATPase n=1 Tax=Paenibacillus sp. TAF43_2 TaxID=3233069 RepID=UPI003F99FDD4
MKTLDKSLGDYIADRTESLDEEFIRQYFVEYSQEKILRLLDSEQYIFEGSRGIGKTMLMKYAALKAKETFSKDSVLGVWISFEESIRLERIRVVDASIDPFLQWTMGKILYEVLIHLINLKPKNIDTLNHRLSSIFGGQASNNFQQYSDLLFKYIELLETGDLDDNSSLKEEAPSVELSRILDNPSSFKKFLKTLIDDFHLSRIVLLFDEAAHVFSHSQQEKFFTFFKSLRDPQIACKAAVYPGITNYGKYFEKGQDAKELTIKWVPNNKENVKYIKEILKKRIQAYDDQYWNKLTVNQDVIDTICVCSNGNPRFAFHIIDELESSGVFKLKNIPMQRVINSIRKVLDSKWKEFNTLKNRLVKYKTHIEEAEKLTKEFIIPNLREWNNKQRKGNKHLSAGFFLSTSVYDIIPELFEVLAYSNILLIDYTKKSIGHSHYGYYITLNPSILFSDLIIRDINEVSKLSVAIERNQSYSAATQVFSELIRILKQETEHQCSNTKCDFKTNDESYAYCPKCGNKIKIDESESLYKILRGHSIDNLKLSEKIITRLASKFSSIGEVYDSTIDDIRMKYIQDVRAEKIKNAAIEYMSG